MPWILWTHIFTQTTYFGWRRISVKSHIRCKFWLLYSYDIDLCVKLNNYIAESKRLCEADMKTTNTFLIVFSHNNLVSNKQSLIHIKENARIVGIKLVLLISYSFVNASKQYGWSFAMATPINQRNQIGSAIHGCFSFNLAGLNTFMWWKLLFRICGRFSLKVPTKNISKMKFSRRLYSRPIEWPGIVSST